jgi:hypothetical protein
MENKLHKLREEKVQFIHELKGTCKYSVVNNIKRPRKDRLLFRKLWWKLARASPPHGVNVLGPHPMGGQGLLDLVHANLAHCHTCFKLSAFFFPFCFSGLLLVGYLGLKLLPVLLG